MTIPSNKLLSSPLLLATSGLMLAGVATEATASLASYDAAIAADHGGGAGPIPHEAVLLSGVVFDSTNSEPFDFGAISGDATFEFIVEGDPLAGGRNGFLGVGTDAAYSLRYEQWDDTGQLGFTHGGVADYVFTPAALSPETPAHLAYRWDSVASNLDLYLDGVLAGTTNAPGFLMPSGAGFLGNNAGGTEGMIGTIHRATIYNSALDPAVIEAHATAWLTDSDPNIQLPAMVELPLDGSMQDFTLDVLNSGENLDLTISGINVGGTDAARFSVTTATPLVVPPGGQATIEFSFDPMGATGEISASLTFESDDPTDDEVTVELSGLIRDPQISVPASLDFGESATAVTQSITVENLGGTQALTITGDTITGSGAGRFSAVVPASVPAGGTAEIEVTFDPGGTVGGFVAQLEFMTNDILAPDVVISLSGSAPLDAGFLSAYDTVIATDHGNGNGLFPYQAALTSAVSVDGMNSAPFDFGSITDDATFEFILEGDPVNGGQNGYLAVGAAPGDNLRYEQWNDTGVLGFTRLGVADNVFTAAGDPALLNSPEAPTHVTYAWDATAPRMDLFINGELAGSNDGPQFAMPSGSGLLGNNAAGTEGMLGTIYRVTTYDFLLDADTILRHALAFTTGAGGAPFQIVSVTYDDGSNQVTIEWNSTAGAAYSVERSFNLVDWFELEDGIPGEEGTTDFTDVTLPADTARAYYRVFVP